MGIDLKAFNQEISKKQSYVRKKAREYVKKVVTDTFETVLAFSPYVTGSFIASNRIDLGAPVPGASMIFPIGLVPRGAAENIAKAQLAKIITMKDVPNLVFISNDIFYSQSVEFGWGPPINRPGHLPYNKAQQHIKAKYDL